MGAGHGITDEQDSHGWSCDGDYCSAFPKTDFTPIVEFFEKSPKPVSGIHIGTSGQGGFVIEGGVYGQVDILMDWAKGDMYVVGTTGGFASVGTPEGLNGEGYIGTSVVHGIPRDVEDISDYLKGHQIDISIPIELDGGVKVGIQKSLSVNIDDNGSIVVIDWISGPVYTWRDSIVLGANAIPNGVDAGLQWGPSESFVIAKYSLWQ